MADLTIPDELVNRIEDRVQYTEFESAEDYAEFVLSEVVTRVEREDDEPREPTASDEDVESRLQSLGYLEE